MRIEILILSVVIGFFIAKILSGKKEGKKGVIKSFEFKKGKYIIHIHHWLLGLMGMIILFVFNYYSDIIYGLLFGIIIQGLTYKDFYRIIYRK